MKFIDKTVLVISRIQKILINTKEHRFIAITTFNGWVHESREWKLPDESVVTVQYRQGVASTQIA